MVTPALDVRDVGGVLVARIGGDVDLSNARDVGSQLTAAVPNAALGVVIDLSDTTYLDSSGVHLIFELAERLRGRQQQLHVALPEDAPLRRVLKIVELDSAVPITASVEEAVAATRQAA